jgi:hypothetical protein
MNEAFARALNMPKGIPTVRYQPPPQVDVPGGQLPLIDQDHPLQQVLNAKVGVFDLSDDNQAEAYRLAWQKITDGHGAVSENKVEFHAGKYIAYLRWAEFTYALPPQV